MPRFLLLLVALALVGCTAPPAPTATDESVEPAATEAPDAVEAPVPDEAAPVEPELAAASSMDPAPAEIVLRQIELEGGVEATLPEGGAGFGGPSGRLELSRARPQGATIVVVWRSEGSPEDTMSFTLSARDVEIATTSGPSPLVLEIPGEAFGDGTLFSASLWPTSAGVYVDGPAQMIATLVY